MDITLSEYLEKADSIHDAIINKHDFINLKKIKNRLYELESYVKQIQSVSYRIAQIYNICKKEYNQNSVLLGDSIKLKTIDLFPEKNTWVSLSRIPKENSKPLVPGVMVNVKTVETCDEIPNTPLYWVNSLNQFAVHVNGIIFRGNIGNIFVKNRDDGESGNFTKNCKHGNKCTFLLNNKKCKFYHDPMDVLELYEEGKIKRETFDMYKNIYKNFNNSSWIYTNDMASAKNKMMRFVGNRNTLRTDMIYAKHGNAEWVDEYKSQTFHDFLVTMALGQNGMIKDYPEIKMVSDDYTGESSLIMSSEK